MKYGVYTTIYEDGSFTISGIGEVEDNKKNESVDALATDGSGNYVTYNLYIFDTKDEAERAKFEDGILINMTCERCSKVYDYDESYEYGIVKNQQDYNTPVDLCPDCTHQLEQWLEPYIMVSLINDEGNPENIRLPVWQFQRVISACSTGHKIQRIKVFRKNIKDITGYLPSLKYSLETIKSNFPGVT